jgi:hypothetical protein
VSIPISIHLGGKMLLSIDVVWADGTRQTVVEPPEHGALVIQQTGSND